MRDQVTNDEPYLRLEEVADRLGLPLSVLLHRVEAGDIPAQRTEDEDGVHYSVRLGDLGIEVDDEGLRASAMRDDDDDDGDEATLSAEFQRDESAASVRSAIVSAFNSGREPLPGEVQGDPDPTSRLDEDDAADALDTSTQHGWADPDSIEPWPEDASPAPAWTSRPREPQQAPVWLSPVPAGEDGEEGATEPTDELDQLEDDDTEDVEDVYVAAEPDADELADDGMPELALPSLDPPPDDSITFDEDTVVAEMAVPPPSRETQFGIVEAGRPGPRGDLASMSLDARELVAGLLDRWERTLEQRIYTEQRQRFQAELVSRQNMVKQLQMELQTARAEHAAAQAEKDRILAGKERELADRERDLAESRWAAEEAERQTATTTEGVRRRRWFWNRYD